MMDSALGTVPSDTGEFLTCISRPNAVPDALQIPVQPPSGRTISVKKNIGNRWTVLQALSPGKQVKNLPGSQQPMHSKMHSYSCSLDDAGVFQKEEKSCSVKKEVNDQQVAPTAPLLEANTRYAPCSQDQTC